MEGNRRRKEEGTFRKWNLWEVCQENGTFGKSLVEIIPYLNRFNGVEEPWGQKIPIGMIRLCNLVRKSSIVPWMLAGDSRVLCQRQDFVFHSKSCHWSPLLTGSLWYYPSSVTNQLYCPLSHLAFQIFSFLTFIFIFFNFCTMHTQP